MPTYRGVEVWIEDSESQKLNPQEASIDLADDRTVTVKTELLRDELYTVHCLSPVSVFCEVFVVTGSGVRRRAARFHLDTSLAVSKDASGSSLGHTEGLFKDRGLRTPRRQCQHGKLGSVEVEIRRIGGIIKDKPREEHEVDGGEEREIEFSMFDDFGQTPWLVFRFDIGVKPTPTLAARRHVSRRIPRSQVSRNSNTGPSNETSREYLLSSTKHSRHDGSSGVGESLAHSNLEQLQKEYQEEEAEERRLLLKLQETLRAKKARNMELRELLGET